jgi:4-hydroxy-tetrahydrodipicolinate synthase
MNPDTVARLAEIPSIVGIKEASGSLVQVAEIYRLAKGKITIMSGDDNLFLPMMSVGVTGVISVLSNAMPIELQDLYKAFLVEKDIQKAMDMNAKLLPIMQAMFVETNPIPIKETLYHMGLIEKEFRLPLCPLSEGSSKLLKGVLREYGLLKRE